MSCRAAVLSDEVLYSAVDAKPKSTVALRRLDNIRAVPWAVMLVDHCDDDGDGAADGGSGSMGARESSTPDPSSTTHCSSSPASTSSNFEMRPRAPSSRSTSPLGGRGLDQALPQLIICTADEREGRAFVTLRGSGARSNTLAVNVLQGRYAPVCEP